MYLSLSSSEMYLWDNVMDGTSAHQNVCWFLFRISLWGVWRGFRLICTGCFVDRHWTEFAVLWFSSLALGYRDHFKKTMATNPNGNSPSKKALWSHSNPASEKNPNNYETNSRFEVTVNDLSLWIWRPFICYICLYNNRLYI